MKKIHIKVANSSGADELGLLCLWVLPLIPREDPPALFSVSLPNTACSVHKECLQLGRGQGHMV